MELEEVYPKLERERDAYRLVLQNLLSEGALDEDSLDTKQLTSAKRAARQALDSFSDDHS